MAQGRLLTRVRRRAQLQRVRRLVFWGVGIFLVYTFVGGEYGFIHYQQLKNRQKRLQIESRKLTARAVALQQEVHRLQFDTLYIEQIAREKHGFARPGERVYMITEY
jgi:cell division protein FtsB